MAALVADTSSWISFLSGSGSNRLADALARGEVHLPPIVLAELLSGKMSERDRDALERSLDGLPLSGSDREHWTRVGRLRARLAGRGVTLTIPDAHVAQSALDLGAELLTEDGVFALAARHLPLRLVT